MALKFEFYLSENYKLNIENTYFNDGFNLLKAFSPLLQYLNRYFIYNYYLPITYTFKDGVFVAVLGLVLTDITFLLHLG